MCFAAVFDLVHKYASAFFRDVTCGIFFFPIPHQDKL